MDTNGAGCSSMSINDEIARFESVHPSIYALYELIENVDASLAAEIRAHVVNIEDSFVNSQEWTLSRSVATINLGLLGDVNSAKSTLVHRYLTRQYLIDTSPEGGRFKKEIIIQNQPHLLLIRDEGGAPTVQFANWVDVLILVAGGSEDVRACFSYVSRLNNYRLLSDVPIVLVATEENEAVQEFKKIPHNLFVQVDVVTGENVDKAFNEAASLKFTFRQNKSKMRNSTAFSLIGVKSSQQQQDKNVGLGRAIPIRQGCVLKKSWKLKKWKKKYLILTENRLCYYDNLQCYMDSKQGKQIELIHANVKRYGEKNFTMTTLAKVTEWECTNKSEREEWVGLIEKSILDSYAPNNCGVSEIYRKNKFCADCGTVKDVTWIVINFGVVICIGCSGIHRGLGCHVSKVRSGKLDILTPTILHIVLLLNGNDNANANIYESTMDKKQKPISGDATPEEKSSFIRRKYKDLEFIPAIVPTREKLLRAISEQNFSKFLTLLLRSSLQDLNSYATDLFGILANTDHPSLSQWDETERGAWLQVLLWSCEEIDPSEKQKMKMQLQPLKCNGVLFDNFFDL